MKSPVEATCPCGNQISTLIKKPSAFKHSVASLTCQKCDSSFLVKCFQVKGVYPKECRLDISILELSKKAKNKVKRQIQDEA
jgi:hypothetical protein